VFGSDLSGYNANGTGYEYQNVLFGNGTEARIPAQSIGTLHGEEFGKLPYTNFLGR
jgi:hypothetical protein